jgi:predicted dehydrogenase
MRTLIIGLGSMGKRRIRNLRALDINDIIGFDLKAARRIEAAKKYGIKTFASFVNAMNAGPDILIIATPPDTHHIYAQAAIKAGKHFFTEVNLVDTGMAEIIKGLKTRKTVGVPSATALFHPAIKKIVEIVNNNSLGKVSNIVYHAGQYLPDWHKHEKVSDYFVSNPRTNGVREIAAFELTWLTHLFGFPDNVCGYRKKTIDIKGAEATDDTLNILLNYNNFLASLVIDVVSRYATRRLLINGEKRQLIWNWDEGSIRIYDGIKNRWKTIKYELGKAVRGYNVNIGEEHYIDEIKSFLNAVKGKGKFVNNFESDLRVLRLLYAIEKSSKTLRSVKI